MTATSTLPPMVRRRARSAIVLASALLGGLLGSHAPPESDVFWQLALGRAVLRNASRSVREPYAIGALGEPRQVPEWLWGVLNYALHQLAGFAGLSLLTLLLGATLGLLAGLLADLLCGERAVPHGARLGWPSQLLLTSLLMSVLATRLHLAPELLGLSLLIAFLLLARALFLRAPQAQLRRGASLVGLTLVWAQLQDSALLSPVLLVCSLNAPAFSRAQRPRLWGLLALLVLASLSGPYGFDLSSYFGDHAHDDAAAHMLEMSPGAFASFQPNSPSGLALSLLAFSCCGALVLAPFRLGDALLALLGLALFLSGARFAGMLAVLSLPLSGSFLQALKEARKLRFGNAAAPRRLAAGLIGLGSLANSVWLVHEFDRSWPLLASGLDCSRFPLRAARVLQRHGKATRVHSAVSAGAVLGFLGDGALQVSIDARIPLHFDDADFASYRDADQSPALLQRYLRRFGVEAAVVQRDSRACRQLEPQMRLVSVDASYATFQLGSGSALPGIDGCSPDHIERGCADAAALQASVRRLREQRDDAYVAWLASLADLECKRGAPQLAFDAMPEPRSLPAIRPAVVRWRVRALLRAGRPAAALDELAQELTERDSRAISVLPEIWDAGHVSQGLLDLYQRSVREMDDATPAAERSKLARLCLTQHDYDCAYFHGLRAALAGDRPAYELLREVLKRHPSAHVRRNLAAWLPQLREQGAP